MFRLAHIRTKKDTLDFQTAISLSTGGQPKRKKAGSFERARLSIIKTGIKEVTHSKIYMFSQDRHSTTVYIDWMQSVMEKSTAIKGKRKPRLFGAVGFELGGLDKIVPII